MALTKVQHGFMESNPSTRPARSLSLFDAISIIVGTIIGSAIFHVPQWVAGQVDSVVWYLGIWAFGGFLACCGALCFAELTTAYNEDGGEYVYIREAYGWYLSFQYAWVTGWIIRPANIAAMAITFAVFGREIHEVLRLLGANVVAEWLQKSPSSIVAMVALTGLTMLNLIGVRAGKWSLNVLTVCKVLGLLLVCLIGSLPVWEPALNSVPTTKTAILEVEPGTRSAAQEVSDDSLQTDSVQTDSVQDDSANNSTPQVADAEVAPEGTSPTKPERYWVVVVSGLLMALVFVMFSYGGWNDISFVAAEIREPNRNLPRALFGGLLVVTLVYLYMNFILVMNLGLGGLASARNAPAELLEMKFNGMGWPEASRWMRSLLGGLVGVSCLGAINAMLITSPRIYYAAGQQHHWFQEFARWNANAQVPRAAISAQWLATMLLLAACAGLAGEWLPKGWQIFKNDNPFDELVAVGSPLFWGFLTLVVVGQGVLRIRDPLRNRPVKTWAFPLPNFVFGTASIFMLYRSSEYAWSQGYYISGGIVLVVFVVGLVLGCFSRVPETPTTQA